MELTKKLRIGGMTCVSCQNRIEKKLQSTGGIVKAKVSYESGTAAVTFDPDVISLWGIASIIDKLDYEVIMDDQKRESNAGRAVGVLIIIVSLYMLMQWLGILQMFSSFQLAEAGMGYGMLFVIGLVTSVHCIAMCGGINLSQCIPQTTTTAEGRLAALRPSFLYNLGRVISYTLVGGIVGALGSVISFSGAMRGIVQLVAGVFMVIMGINMLGIFPWLRRFTPRMPRIFARKIDAEKGRSNSPLYVGLLNGLMPCGPLQAMQLYALSTGDPVKGALSMLLFSLGTVPLMFGIGALSSILSKKFTSKVMTVGAVLVVVLGLSMFTQGWSLSRFSGLPFVSASGSANSAQSDSGIVVENGVQIINSTLSSGRYPAITVQAGIPVKWTIDAPDGSINGCNNRMFIPEYDIEYSFQPRENVIEFIPEKTGTFQYSCWMGMIRSTITVVDDGGNVPQTQDNGDAQPNGGGGCCGGDSTQNPASSFAYLAPVPAGYTITTDNVAVAEKVNENGSEYQQVTITLTDEGFSPAVAVLQAGIETQLIIINESSRAENGSLLFPIYSTQVPLTDGIIPLYLYPTDSFDFSTGDNAFYAYVKVVDGLDAADLDAVKEEAGNYQTMIWPPETFASNGGGAACH